jgi:hypothetical protein
MPSPFIADGYTRSARIDGSESHPPLHFEYRPMLWSDLMVLTDRISQLNLEDEREVLEADRRIAVELDRRLVTWTLNDAEGKPAPISTESLARIEIRLFIHLTEIVFGLSVESRRQEIADRENLVAGVALWLTAPQLALRDCGDCERHVYNERTGRRSMHAGRPVERPAGTRAPCRLPHVGCLKGTPEAPRALSIQNRLAYQHYEECLAVGEFPDDPIVRRHAMLIRSVEASVRDRQRKVQPPRRFEN